MSKQKINRTSVPEHGGKYASVAPKPYRKWRKVYVFTSIGDYSPKH